MAKKHWIGFDLGGTKMMSKVYDAGFKPVGKARTRSKGHEGKTKGLERMVETIEASLDKAGVKAGDLAGIGVGCPGPLDLDAGVVLNTPNLGWKNVPVRETLEKASGCPAVICNDVDSGVFGEYRFGAAKGARCVVGVFPGTGIGGGAVYDGKILRGKKGSAMELGHIPVVRDGPLCGCGRRGCLEAVASRMAISSAVARAAYRGEASYLMQRAGTDISEIRSGALSDSIKNGDKAVERIVREAARTIGWAVSGVVNLLAPDIILLGGGLVEEMPRLFKEEVRKGLKAQVMPAFESSFKVVAAGLGDDAGVKGAAAWAAEVVEGDA